MNQNYPVALFKAEQNQKGETVYRPFNGFGVALCELLGKMTMNEKEMIITRRNFRVLEPDGQALPYPKSVNVLA